MNEDLEEQVRKLETKLDRLENRAKLNGSKINAQKKRLGVVRAGLRSYERSLKQLKSAKIVSLETSRNMRNTVDSMYLEADSLARESEDLLEKGLDAQVQAKQISAQLEPLKKKLATSNVVPFRR